jgi:hypothetical protein
MKRPSRTRLVALAVLLAVAAPLVVVALVGSGDDEADERPAGLRVERTPGGLPEITIYLEDRSLNKRSTTGGAAKVVLECVDAGGRIVWNARSADPSRTPTRGRSTRTRTSAWTRPCLTASPAAESPAPTRRSRAACSSALTDRSHALKTQNRVRHNSGSSLQTNGR